MRPPALPCALGVAAALLAATAAAAQVEVGLSAEALLRPQNEELQLHGDRPAHVFDDERVRFHAEVTISSPDPRWAVRSVGVEFRAAEREAWDLTGWRELPASAEPLVLASRTAPGVERAPLETWASEARPGPRFSHVVEGSLPVQAGQLRLYAETRDGDRFHSEVLRVRVRRAPRFLTLISQGGSCIDPTGALHFADLGSSGIRVRPAGCAEAGLSPEIEAGLAEMSSVNCDDLCDPGCTNVLEHLALTLLREHGLAREFESIDDAGERFCARRTNPEGLDNHIVLGRWRNMDEERVCPSALRFEDVVDAALDEGRRHLILIGQSHGGALFARMLRDGWRWGEEVAVPLFVSMDATSFRLVPSWLPGLGCCPSMGVRRLGPRPARALNFFQHAEALPFQNGAPIAEAPGGGIDLTGCLSHNAIPRSREVQRRILAAVRDAIQATRDAER